MKAHRGFTLVEIMIVVAIIGLLTAIAIPAFLQYRLDARKTLCETNLRSVFTAKGSWVADQLGNSTVVPGYAFTAGDLVGIYAYLDDVVPACPSGGSYTWGVVDQNPSCDSPEVHLLNM